LIKEKIELENIPEDIGLTMDDNISNHASNIFSDPDVCKWFSDNVVEPREWKLHHPDDFPPNYSKDIMLYSDRFNLSGLKLWNIGNDQYSAVRLNLVSKANPAISVNISGRGDYLVTKVGIKRVESLSHCLCIIKKQSDGKEEVQCEHVHVPNDE
jgi:hypothetical protein